MIATDRHGVRYELTRTAWARQRKSDAHGALITALVLLCRARRVPCARINQRPVRKADGRWSTPGADPGVWDLCVRIPTGVLWVEAKTGKARLSPGQLEFQRVWEGDGEAYLTGVRFLVARSVDDLDRVLETVKSTNDGGSHG